MGSLKNCILSVCLVLAAVVITQIDGQGAVSVERGVNHFSSSLFKPVAQNASGNVLVSPTGAAITLAMLAYGSGGQTKSQFSKLLNLPHQDGVGESGYQSLIDSLQDLKKNELIFASKIFVTHKSPIKQSYKKLLKTYFHSEAQTLDFDKSSEAANTINTWVQNVAKDHPGHIKHTVTPADLGPNTRVVVVNPIYFKGKWKNGFNTKNTQQRPFKLNKNKEKKVATMSKTGVFTVGELENKKAKYVVLPLQGDELSLIVLLPNDVNGLAAVEKELQKIDIPSLVTKGSKRNVELHLPKFKFNSKIDLKGPLHSLGLTDAFDKHANFSGISNSKLEITKIVQNTHVEVDEEGGDIDAGSADIASRIALPPEKFDVNHPFHVFIVRNNKAGSNGVSSLTLYTGRIIDPKF